MKVGVEGAFTKEDFSIREMMELQTLAYAKDLFEAMKKQTGFPLEMDNVTVHVELTLLKPIGYDEGVDERCPIKDPKATHGDGPINWFKKVKEIN